MNPFAIVLPVTLALYGSAAMLERFPSLRFKASPFARAFFATDVAWYLSTLGLVLLTRPLLAQLPSMPLTAFLDAQPLWIVIPAAAVVYDFVAFLVHLVLHRSDALWEFHKIHHSSRTLDWLATTRQHVVEGMLRTFTAQAVLLLIGFPVTAVAGVLAVYAGFAVYGHSNLRLPLAWLEPIFVTPRIHRLHHIPGPSVHNFGTIFSFWDRAFGSLLIRDARSDEPCGVPDEVASFPQRFGPSLIEPFRRVAGASGIGEVQLRHEEE